MGVLANKMSHPENNNNNDRYGHETMSEKPTAIDSRRPPQLNDDNLGCHCECRCSRATNDSNGDAVTSHDHQVSVTPTQGEEDDTNYDCSDDDGDLPVEGEEGAEDHLIELGGLGLVSLGLIHRSLARHTRCTCHGGVLPHPDDYPFANSPMPSGFQSPHDSMIVEPSSGEHSMMSSQVLSVCSRSSSVLFHVGTGQSCTPGAFPILWNPLRLTEEVRFEYPAELSVAGSQFSVSRGDLAEHGFC